MYFCSWFPLCLLLSCAMVAMHFYGPRGAPWQISDRGATRGEPTLVVKLSMLPPSSRELQWTFVCIAMVFKCSLTGDHMAKVSRLLYCGCPYSFLLQVDGQYSERRERVLTEDIEHSRLFFRNRSVSTPHTGHTPHTHKARTYFLLTDMHMLMKESCRHSDHCSKCKVTVMQRKIFH